LTGETLKLIGFILPLGLDTFGVALALGIAGLPRHSQLRVALLFAGFETAMPLIGIGLGVPLGRALGSGADYVASVFLLGLGLYLLLADEDGNDGRRLVSMSQRGLFGAAALGVSVSLDELAIGFSAGLLRLPVVPLVVAVGLQAFAVTLVGVRVGARLGERWQESAERLAGAALLILGATLLAVRLTG
jgi:putative Mn2+ efflux pump MntP